MRKLQTIAFAVAMTSVVACAGMTIANTLRAQEARGRLAEASERLAEARASIAAQFPPIIPQAAAGVVATTGTVWVGSSASSGTITNSTVIGTGPVQCYNGMCRSVPVVVSVAAPPRPALSIYCTDEACQAQGYGGSMENAKALLERIANHSTRVEVAVHDAACNVQRETIQPRPKEDLVAEAR
jgi:hypothetical protein